MTFQKHWIGQRWSPYLWLSSGHLTWPTGKKLDSSKYIPIFGWDTPQVDGCNPSILISNVVEQSKSIRNHHFSHPLVMRIETTSDIEIVYKYTHCIPSYPGIPRYPICYFRVLLLKQWFPYIAGKTINGWLYSCTQHFTTCFQAYTTRTLFFAKFTNRS